ncbi:MAG: hypothetical protein MJ054_02815, partial [Clostridia bacterium]|nr:hypothetical protein [Clostridia bacterium]
MAEEFYRFNPLLDRNGKPSKYHHYFVDDNNFNVNSTLIEQIDFSSCRETTAEGRAIWLYIRLCQLLQYDEGY